jgi:hypothetical protein
MTVFCETDSCNSDVRWIGQEDQSLGHIFFFTQFDFFRGEFVMEYATCIKKGELFVGYLKRCFNCEGPVGRKDGTYISN